MRGSEFAKCSQANVCLLFLGFIPVFYILSGPSVIERELFGCPRALTRRNYRLTTFICVIAIHAFPCAYDIHDGDVNAETLTFIPGCVHRGFILRTCVSVCSLLHVKVMVDIISPNTHEALTNSHMFVYVNELRHDCVLSW